MEKGRNVRFIRRNGRIIPIKVDKGFKSKRKARRPKEYKEGMKLMNSSGKYFATGLGFTGVTYGLDKAKTHLANKSLANSIHHSMSGSKKSLSTSKKAWKIAKFAKKSTGIAALAAIGSYAFGVGALLVGGSVFGKGTRKRAMSTKKRTSKMLKEKYGKGTTGVLYKKIPKY